MKVLVCIGFVALVYGVWCLWQCYCWLCYFSYPVLYYDRFECVTGRVESMSLKLYLFFLENVVNEIFPRIQLDKDNNTPFTDAITEFFEYWPVSLHSVFIAQGNLTEIPRVRRKPGKQPSPSLPSFAPLLPHHSPVVLHSFFNFCSIAFGTQLKIWR